MYHNVHVLNLSDMYTHVHTCVHVNTYVVFIYTYRVIPGYENWQIETTAWNLDVRLDKKGRNSIQA